jgi:hypothetical protein
MGAQVAAGLYRKTAALPGTPRELRILVCARERVISLPDGATDITAAGIFS